MPTFVPVDHDPFADAAPPSGRQPTLTPVDHDPFAPDPSTVPVESGALLPMSRFADGHVGFDSHAGVGGMVRGLLGVPQAATEAAANLDAARTTMAGAEPGSPTYQAAQGQAVDAAGAALGAVAPLSPASAASRGVGALADGLVARGTRPATAAEVDAPSAEALRAAAGEGYKRARDLGVIYHPQAVADMASKAQQDLEAKGFIGENAPLTFSILGKLQDPPAGGFMPFGGLEAARQAFGKVAGKFSVPGEQAASGAAQDAIDDFVMAADPASVLHGPASSVGGEILRARANYAAAKRTEQLAGVAEAADNRAAAANSGANIGNATRGRIASLLASPKGIAGFTDDEVGQLKQLVQGTMPQNLSRKVGNILGGGGGLGSVAGAFLGAHAAGPMGAAAAPAIGMAAKAYSNASTTGMLDKIIADTAKRSPLFDEMLAGATQGTKGLDYDAAADASVPFFARLMAGTAPASQSRTYP